ncbi:MAG TPA: rhodanese-like domain-containing protein [Polyangiaceae bacterium]|nr:rhodanese-like domain-containing protein [Polyangiaceae bacterium]
MPLSQEGGAVVERIGPSEARTRMGRGAVYLDVRSVPEFEQGHPLGAYNIPLMHLEPGGMRENPDFLRVVEAVFSKERPMVIGCKCGERSLTAAKRLIDEGFTHVVDQRAGYDGVRGAFGQIVERGWRGEGLPVAERAQEGRSWRELREGL